MLVSLLKEDQYAGINTTQGRLLRSGSKCQQLARHALTGSLSLSDYIRAICRGNLALTERASTGFPRLHRLAALLLVALSLPAMPTHAQSGAARGQSIAFDRAKGNCLSCHKIAGGDLPGTIGPELKGIKEKYPDRKDLIAILNDESQRNPQTAMPPFGRNRILTDQEIDAIVDFLETL